MKARLPLLLLACGGLAWAVAAQGGASTRAPPPPTPVRPLAATEARLPVTPVSLPAPPAGSWPEQVERPLFAPGRRPPAIAVAPPSVDAPPEPPPPVAANGVVLRSAGAVALLRLVDERVVRAAEGEEVEGWLVTSIGAEGVRLSRGNRMLHLPVRARSAEGVLRH